MYFYLTWEKLEPRSPIVSRRCTAFFLSKYIIGVDGLSVTERYFYLQKVSLRLFKHILSYASDSGYSHLLSYKLRPVRSL